MKLWGIVFGLVNCLIGIGVPVAHGAEDRVMVVATTMMVGDLLREVGGNAVEVEVLMGPGVDPHLFKPNAGHVAKLKRAKGIFYNGLNLEARLGQLLETLEKSGQPVFQVTQKIAKEKLLLLEEEGETGFDPHVWGDVALWAECVPIVVEGLSVVKPAAAVDFAKRGEALQERLMKVHVWAQEQGVKVPEKQRVLITSHDAFGYFGRAYGFEVVGLQGISTVSEAGLADLTKLVEYVRTRAIPAVFIETSVAPAAMKRVSEDSGAEVGGELFSDSMGVPGELRDIETEKIDVGTYEGMIKWNISTVVKALNPDA